MAHEKDEEPEHELDQALLSFLRRHDQGERVDRDAFLKDHPALEGQLKVLLDAADWIEQMAGPKVGDSGNLASSDDDRSATKTPDDPNEITVDLHMRAFLHGHVTHIDEGTTQEHRHEFSLSDVPTLDNTQSSLPCRFGEYMLEKVLGRGGMGVVYLANQVQLNRRVAIKMIRSGALATSDEVSRFYSEARSVAKLDHPNIVTVYHCGENSGHHFFSMDYIPGTDLAKRVSVGPMDPKEAVRYVREVALAIDYAHFHGVVHRDLKPANVLIDQNDRVVITDFGLAKQMGGEQGLTATGAALGTPSYMSPEQAAGKSEEQGEATDVYAMGAILFALLTGKPPFQAETVLQTLMQVMQRPAPSVRQLRSDVHGDLETIVSKCLEKSPALRYASARDLAADLDRFYNGHPIVAKPPSWPRRFGFWISTVPLVAAFTGSRPLEPSASQRWAQNGFILAMACILIGIFFGGSILRWFTDGRLPSRITIASGAPGGMYFDVAGQLSDRMQTSNGRRPSVLSTGGSYENLRQLLEYHADIALMQESTIRADQVSVVAPLFIEAIHVLIPKDSDIRSLKQLAGQKIVMGARDSGTRQAALRLLKHFQLTESDFEIIDGDWTQAAMRGNGNILIAVVKAEQSGMGDLLASGEYRLLSIDNAHSLLSTEPMFRLYEFEAGAYRGTLQKLTETLSTTALLVVRKDAPSRLVEECLKATYADPPLVQGLIPPEMAAGWQGLPYHDAARRFFESRATP